MSEAEKTIEQVIDELAAHTDGLERLAGKVKNLFLAKGIPLHADAAPYADAIRDTFERQAQTHAACERLREEVRKLQVVCDELVVATSQLEQDLRGYADALRAARAPRDEPKANVWAAAADGVWN